MKRWISTYLLLFIAVLTASAQSHVYDVTAYGALGDGKANDAAAIQRAIDQCSAEGGGQVYFPRNHTFLAGPIQLKSHVELHLDATATLKADPDERLYRLSAFGKNEGEGMLWLWGKGCDNVAFSGRGTIDGNGVAFMGRELSDSYELKPVTTFDPRPHVLTLYGCTKVSLRDLTIREGAYWTVHLVGCDDVVIDGVDLLNNLKIRNGDGIDIDHSSNVRIANCHITSGDDCVCLKNRREFAEYGSCHDITVSNCTMTSRSCAVKLGSENMDSIYNVTIADCIITASNRGLGIQNRDEGTVTDVSFSNIIMDCRLWSDVWWGKAEPIYVTSYPRADGNHKDANWRFPEGQTEGRSGEVSRIHFTNIFATSENGCFIGGDTDTKVRDITLTNVRLNLCRQTAYQGGIYDKRPCKGAGFVSDKVYGLYVGKASHISADLHVEAAPGIDYGGVSNRPQTAP